MTQTEPTLRDKVEWTLSILALFAIGYTLYSVTP